MIEFTEVQSQESLGTVDIEDGELIGPFNLQSMIDAWLRQDKSPEEFMEFYGGDGWSNGYILSQEVAGKAAEEAPAEATEELRTRAQTFAQGSEELSPVTVVEKLRDIVAEDVKAHPEVGPAGAEAVRELDLYVELINEAESDEDVKEIIEDILEMVPIADYEGAEDIVEFLQEFTDGAAEPEKKEEPPAKAKAPAKTEEPAETLSARKPLLIPRRKK